MPKKVSAPGKIILSGEYGGRILGHPSIVMPAPFRLTASLTEDEVFRLEWPEIEGRKDWPAYIRDILLLLAKKHGPAKGVLKIENTIPLGKGMGSSTALVIALSRIFIAEDAYDEALQIENMVNPGHSGMDFAVIWEDEPIYFSADKGAKVIELDRHLLDNAFLIDTGTPKETTPELVAFVKEHKDQFREASQIMAHCTQQMLDGDDLKTTLRDHHRAQCALGIVPAPVQTLIASIEDAGGAAKVIGAGGISGGAGMVLTTGVSEESVQPFGFPIVHL